MTKSNKPSKTRKSKKQSTVSSPVNSQPEDLNKNTTSEDKVETRSISQDESIVQEKIEQNHSLSDEIAVQETISIEKLDEENKELQQVSNANETITDTKQPVSDLIIDQAFLSLLPPLTSDEYAFLEESLLKNKLRDPIEVWNNIIIDGHNRYQICKKHNIEIKIKELSFNSREEAIDYVYRNQIARRNLSDKKRNYAWGKVYSLKKNNPTDNLIQNAPSYQNDNSGRTCDILAEQFNTSAITIVRAGKYADSIDKISNIYGNQLRDILLSKEMKISDKYVLDFADKCEAVNENIQTLLGNNDLNELKRQIVQIAKQSDALENTTDPEVIEENENETYQPGTCPECGSSDEIADISLINKKNDTDISSTIKICLNCNVLLDTTGQNIYSVISSVYETNPQNRHINQKDVITKLIHKIKGD